MATAPKQGLTSENRTILLEHSSRSLSNFLVIVVKTIDHFGIIFFVLLHHFSAKIIPNTPKKHLIYRIGLTLVTSPQVTVLNLSYNLLSLRNRVLFVKATKSFGVSTNLFLILYNSTTVRYSPGAILK
jgi:hypothetical protein